MLRILIAIPFAISVANAGIVYSNYTGVAGGGGFSIFGAAVGPQSVAQEFTPTADYTLTDAIVYVASAEFGPDDAVNVFLFSDSSGLPGGAIEEIGSDLSPTGSRGPITANSIATPINLISGTPYWLVLTPEDSHSAAYWDDGGSSNVPAATSNSNGTGIWNLTNTSGQMEIDGTLAPEPASFLAIGSGLVVLAGVVFRRAKRSPVI